MTRSSDSHLSAGQSLVDFIRVNYGDTRPGEEITVYEPTDVLGILFLPAAYRAA